MIISIIGGGVILNNEGKIVVVQQQNNKWSLPKGHIEEGEDLLDGAKREIYEETGLTDLTLIKKLGSYERFKIGKENGTEDKNELKQITIFLFTTTQTTLAPIDKDNPQALWVDREKASELLSHTKDKEFLKSILHTL